MPFIIHANFFRPVGPHSEAEMAQPNKVLGWFQLEPIPTTPRSVSIGPRSVPTRNYDMAALIGTDRTDSIGIDRTFSIGGWYR
jgi:hypothetical protein